MMENRNKLYGRRWKAAARGHLQRNPFCVRHLKLGQHKRATLVDHEVPHRGDVGLFWDRTNWQSLCKPCHDGPKQRQEKGGRDTSCDVNGIPLDPRHAWRQEPAAEGDRG